MIDQERVDLIMGRHLAQIRMVLTEDQWVRFLTIVVRMPRSLAERYMNAYLRWCEKNPGKGHDYDITEAE